MAVDYVIGTGTTLPVIAARLTDRDGNPVPLSGASVQFVMRRPWTDPPLVIGSAVVTDVDTGDVQYSWATADTAVSRAGTYQGWWKITYPGGGTMKVPADGYHTVVVQR